MQHVLVQEGERFVSVLQAGQRLLFRFGQEREEAAHVGDAEVAGVAQAVEADEAADPVGEARARFRVGRNAGRRPGVPGPAAGAD